MAIFSIHVLLYVDILTLFSYLYYTEIHVSSDFLTYGLHVSRRSTNVMESIKNNNRGHHIFYLMDI